MYSNASCFVLLVIKDRKSQSICQKKTCAHPPARSRFYLLALGSFQKKSKSLWICNSSTFYTAQLWARGRVRATFFVIRDILFSFLWYSKHKTWCVVMHAKPFITSSDNKNKETESIRSYKKKLQNITKIQVLICWLFPFLLPHKSLKGFACIATHHVLFFWS